MRISMDGRARWADNVLMERTWRSMKYEHFFMKEWLNLEELKEGTEKFVRFFNSERPHQGLGYRTPDEVYESRSFSRMGEEHIKKETVA